MTWFRKKSKDENSAKTFNLMAEQKETNLRQIESEKNEMETILGSMIEQVIAVGSSGKIRMLNPSAEKLFGVQNQETIGKSFVEVIRHAAISDIVYFVLTHHQEKSQEIQLFLPEERYFEVRAVPIKNEAKNQGALLVLHDITQIKKLENLRRDFVANVSHEMRTPLTSIQGYAETLLSGAIADSEHNREFLETIHSQAGRLTHLVDDLLNLAALESGRKKLNLTTVSLPDLLKEIEDTMRPLVQKHEVSLKVNIQSFLDTVSADREQLKQVFLNLVDNAVKFNKKDGKVTINLHSNGSSVTVSVEDTGIGITKEDLLRIFERFYRVEKARSRELGGTGLGLAIVKHIVESHGGTIQVESALNVGSTFRIILPKATA